MHRRAFLQAALALPAATAAQSPPRVIIIGAGLAGLSAAYELDRLGCSVTILEARTRPGGRVFTMREPFSDGLYAEVGAARIQDSHEFTLKYAKQFNLTLDPFFPSEGSRVSYIGGKRLVVPAGRQPDLSEMPLNFSAEEKAAGLGGTVAKYLMSHIHQVGDPRGREWPDSSLRRFEISFQDFLVQQGASTGMQKIVPSGHDLHGMSALQVLRDAALAVSTKQWFKIRGGNDQLPKAFAAKLADKILYGVPVVRLEQNERSVRAVYLRAGTPVTADGDYMICAIPLTVMRRLEISPAVSPQKRAAIDRIDYIPSARVFLQSRRRFWLDRGESGWATTDDPMDVWDYTRDQPGRRGILGAYTIGRMALEITYLDRENRTRLVLEKMDRVHPGIRDHFEGSASHSWVTDPWSLGAAAEFKPGQLSELYRYLSVPEGRIHFAGEHTSPWTAWMNGGLESGNRAASEIRAKLSGSARL